MRRQRNKNTNNVYYFRRVIRHSGQEASYNRHIGILVVFCMYFAVIISIRLAFYLWLVFFVGGFLQLFSAIFSCLVAFSSARLGKNADHLDSVFRLYDVVALMQLLLLPLVLLYVYFHLPFFSHILLNFLCV